MLRPPLKILAILLLPVPLLQSPLKLRSRLPQPAKPHDALGRSPVLHQPSPGRAFGRDGEVAGQPDALCVRAGLARCAETKTARAGDGPVAAFAGAKGSDARGG